MREAEARAIVRVLHQVVVVRDDPYWHYYCRCCKGRSQSQEISYRPNLNARDYPCQHEADCPVLVVEALLPTGLLESD